MPVRCSLASAAANRAWLDAALLQQLLIEHGCSLASAAANRAWLDAALLQQLLIEHG